jgi:hypothetical protein
MKILIGLMLLIAGITSPTPVHVPHGMYNTPTGYAPTYSWDRIFNEYTLDDPIVRSSSSKDIIDGNN